MSLNKRHLYDPFLFVCQTPWFFQFSLCLSRYFLFYFMYFQRMYNIIIRRYNFFSVYEATDEVAGDERFSTSNRSASWCISWVVIVLAIVDNKVVVAVGGTEVLLLGVSGSLTVTSLVVFLDIDDSGRRGEAKSLKASAASVSFNLELTVLE